MTVLIVFFLLLCCGASGCGMWLGWSIGRGEAIETVEYVATATRDAYEQGFADGVAAWFMPAPPERPYDIEADR